MMRLRLKVKGYCVRPTKSRTEILKSQIIEEEIKTRKEVEESKMEGKEEKNKKETTKRTKEKPEEIYELPDKYNSETGRYYGLKRTINYLYEQFPYELQGLFKSIIHDFPSMKKPPEGRYGYTNSLNRWVINIEEINDVFVHFRKWAKKITVKGRTKGSFDQYADQIDFNVVLNIDSPIFYKDEIVELFMNVLRYLPLSNIGAFRHGRIVKYEVINKEEARETP